MFPIAPFSPDGFSAVTTAIEKIATITANIGHFIIYITASIARFEGSCKFKKTVCRFILPVHFSVSSKFRGAGFKPRYPKNGSVLSVSLRLNSFS
jgi:hypothetical protein